MSERVHYIDWLRVLAVLLLFPFHVSRVFNAGDPFYVKSDSVSVPLSYLLGFIDVWHMPLLFFLAGSASYFALRHRSAGQYSSERVRRLLLPFLFGWLVLIPPQTWYGARFNSGYDSSFAAYLLSGDFLVWNIRDGGDYYGGFGLGHLWFILWLFVISMVALPLLAWGGKEGGTARLRAAATRLASPGWWIVAAFVIFLGDAMPDPVGKNPFYFLAFFVLGYVVMFADSFSQAAEKRRWPALLVGAALSAAWVAMWPLRDALPDPSLPIAAIALMKALAIWLVLIGAVGFGRRYLDRPSSALTYLSPASYPLYILHQTVIVIAAFYLVALPVPGVAQWFALLAVSVAATFALYEVVRRVPVISGLCGIKRQTPRVLAQAAGK